MKNFLRFRELIQAGNKIALKTNFERVKENVLTFTGNKIRKIMKILKKSNLRELNFKNVKEINVHNPDPDEEMWRVENFFPLSALHDYQLLLFFHLF